MKKQAILGLTTLLIFLVSFAKGQTNFRQGYIITSNSDTIFGLLLYENDNKSSKTCVFKKDDYSEQIEHTPSSIKAYRFINGKYYISKLVNIDNEKQNIFVEYLVNGIANLYYFDDGSKKRYLVEKEDGVIVELTNEEKTLYIQGKGELTKKTKRYIGLLKAVFSDCPEIQKEIDQVEFTHKSLINITKYYHQYVCNGEECIVYEKAIPPFKLKLAPIAVYGIIGLNILNSEFYYSGFNFERSMNPVFGISAERDLPAINEKMSLQFDGTLSNQYFYGYYFKKDGAVDEYYDTHNNLTLAQSTIGLNYTSRRIKLMPSFGFGVMANYVFNHESFTVLERVHETDAEVYTYESNYLPLAKFLIGGYLQLGCDYRVFTDKIFFSNLMYGFAIGTIDKIESSISSLVLKVGIYL